MKQYKTFGETLSGIMQSKNCSMKELAEKMGYKSPNTISRIMLDKSSLNKINSFYKELIRVNPLQLVEHERISLQEAINVNVMGRDAYSAQKKMIYFVKERIPKTSCVCKRFFGEENPFITTLDDMMDTYKDFMSVDIMLENCAFGGVTKSLKAFLEQCNPTKVKIEHYVSSNENKTTEIEDFLNLLDVMGHPNYNFYFSPYQKKADSMFLNMHGNFMVVLKVDTDGNKWTDLVSFCDEDSFVLLYNLPGEETYQFHLFQFQTLRLQHNPVKISDSGNFNLEGIMSYYQKLLSMDLAYPLFSIRPDISLCMVPPDIAVNVTRTSNKNFYLGDKALFARYSDVLEKKYQFFVESRKPQTYLFSQKGMYQFLKQGKSRANVFGLRDLTKEEIRRVLEGILSVAKNVPTTTIRLLKNDLHYNNISYLLYASETLLVDGYQGFRNYDPTQNYHTCWIKTPSITQSFSNFAKHDLFENYTCSHQDTVTFLEQLLQM